MKLRHLFVITFCCLTLIPLVLFWAWPYSKALESELKDVKQRHLVIAQNLSAAFERYYQDVTGIFTIIDTQSDAQLNSQGFNQLLSSYDFMMVAKFDERGVIKRCLFRKEQECPSTLDSDTRNLMIASSSDNEVTLSTVTANKLHSNEPMLLVVKKQQENFWLGFLSTRYIVEMGKKVAFGEKGHAAIVDQKGNVLAHPLSAWVKERKNIAGVSAVQKMLEGKTGVEEFYSPALKGDMIAGYTYVPNAGWGVMVPQPIKELKVKAEEIDQMAMLVMFLGVALALFITIPMSFNLIRPLENLLRTIRSIESGRPLARCDYKKSQMMPQEICEITDAFSSMMEKVENNKKEISQLAYFDSVTGLPNRRYFRILFEQAYERLKKSNEIGALVFIDFDDFKSVNDTYGHRVGDELLNQFGKNLMRHFKINTTDADSLSYYDALPDVIPSRLGGDEFAIFIKNVKDEHEVNLKIRQLFDDVFSNSYSFGEAEIQLTGSAGIAMISESGLEYDAIIRSADMAMYQAKLSGKNRIRMHAA